MPIAVRRLRVRSCGCPPSCAQRGRSARQRRVSRSATGRSPVSRRFSARCCAPTPTPSRRGGGPAGRWGRRAGRPVPDPSRRQGRIARERCRRSRVPSPDTQIEPDIAVSPLDPRSSSPRSSRRFLTAPPSTPFRHVHDGGGPGPTATCPPHHRGGRRWAGRPIPSWRSGRAAASTSRRSSSQPPVPTTAWRSSARRRWLHVDRPVHREQDGCGGFHDKNWITVDTSPTSPLEAASTRSGTVPQPKASAAALVGRPRRGTCGTAVHDRMARRHHRRQPVVQLNG